MRRYLRKSMAVVLALILCLSSILTGAYAADSASSLSYGDVPEGVWYYDAVQFVTERGFMEGSDTGDFLPETPTTRSQFAAVLYHMEGEPEAADSAAFTDVPSDAWYAAPVSWASGAGLIQGVGGGQFLPDESIHRQDLIVMAYRYAQHKGCDMTRQADLSAFRDADEVADYALTAVRWAVAEGVVLGGDGLLSPGRAIQRCETAALLTRLAALPGLTASSKPTRPSRPSYNPTPVYPDNPEVNLNEYGLAEDIEDGAILHAWCWNFNTIKEMIPQIAAAGFSAVQTSPINSIIEGDNGGLQISGKGKWYYHYQPTEYEEIGNYQLGTDEEFREMCEVAHQYGVKVIVDQVLNHMTASEGAISDKIKNEIDWGDPGEWGNPEKPWTHKNTGTQWSEKDRFEETQNPLSGLIEWNTQNENVQQYLRQWLETCVAAGADGFRYDAAKLIELPDDISVTYPEYQFSSDFWPTVLQNGASFQYGEVLQEGEPNHIYSPELTGGYNDQDSSRLSAYQSQTFTTADGEKKNMNTTLSFYGFRLRDAISSGHVDAGFVGDMLVPEGASAQRAVTWVESHDNYCNNASYSELSEQQVIQAWAILSARKEGTPLFFSRPKNSSASNPWGDNAIGPEGSHFFMDAQVVAVNFFRNEMGDREEYLSNPTGSDKVIMIERGTAGAVIVNLLDEDLVLDKVPVQSMADGAYTDQVYGSAFTVQGGKLSGVVKAGKVAVVYDSKVDSPLAFEPEITLSVPTGDFLTDTLDVSVSVRGVDRAAYQIGGGEAKPVANGDVITIGEGVQADESVTLTLSGYNAAGELVAQASATYTKRLYNADTVVYIEDALCAAKGWNQAYVYIWVSVNNANLSNQGWPGAKAVLQTDGDWAGYWKYVVPYELESIANLHVIVHGNTGSQIEKDEMLISPGQAKVLTADESWVDGDTVTNKAKVYMSPGGGTTFTDSLSVTLYALNCASATYQLDGGAPVPYTSGESITIGGGMENNDTATVALAGYDADGQKVAQASATYTKRIYEGKAAIYVDPAVKPEWDEIAVYLYGSSLNNGSWPGYQLTEADMENGLYVYPLPENLQGSTLTVIFNNNNHGEQVEHGWKIGPDQRKIWRADESVSYGVWEDHIIETVIYISKDFCDGKAWQNVNAHIYNENNATTTWPGIPGVLQESGVWAGYYKVDVPADRFEDLNDLRVILNNGDQQIDVGSGNDVDIAWGQTKVLTAGGLWVNGYELTASSVYATPGSGAEFYGNTLDVTLHAENVVSASYKVGETGETVPYEDGAVITIGQDAADNETITVYLEGTNAGGITVTDTAAYTKHFAAGEEELSVLFIGNSYTYYNDGVWSHFQKLAYSAGYNVKVDSVTIGSHHLYEFANPSEADPNGGPLVEKKLSTNQYDYVFLQEQSTYPITNYNDFADAAEKLYDRIMLHNDACKVILYQTWGRESGSSNLTQDGRGWTNETMTHDLEYAYAKLGETLNVPASPAGTAFHDVYADSGAKIDMYDADQTHPTLAGTYLASLVHIGTVFGKEAVERAVGYTAGLPEGTVQRLKQAALDAPEKAELPYLYLTPAAEETIIQGDSLTLTLHAVNVSNAAYQINGGTETPFVHGEKIVITRDDLRDGKVTVTLKGEDAGQEPVVPVDFTYSTSAVEHYLVLGWYAKTETSGLDEKVIEAFVSEMKAYLRAQGATEAQLADIVVRAYTGNVADMGASIKADNDVDVMIGVGENIDAPTSAGGATAGVPIIEKTNGIYMGTSKKNRWMARLTEDETAVTVYNWIKDTYDTAPTAV
ncbi:S-layer homology domain-containing protein [Pseudoflavonifractor phocaeensis]|uniref:S-layer homology domain-containing protein n=1 Tax=Pseudoflavonifractor phocaeensis TaxID=1870988 RepID=UPI002109B236|nr:S-layer homology domain-containing protein [Pseudoflavonifractor phocaeensis]MCQ4863485.1 starch-binding protein [Pseudoflavonifractor phocaeensis]